MSQNHTPAQSETGFGRRRTPPRPSSQSSVPKTAGSSLEHIVWFDYAKGICILLVIMMHSTLGVAREFGGEGFMHYIVAFAKPFRMPDFFLLSGLFLSRAITRSWPHYLDKKVAHFAYFYLLWLVILVVIKAIGKHEFDVATLSAHFYDAIIGPYPALWFIYVLPLFFVVTKLAMKLPGYLLFGLAAGLQLLPEVTTGWRAIDHYAVHYYVFFVAGYLLAPKVFELAAWARENVKMALVGVLAWALINGALAFSPSPIVDWPTLASLPIISIVLGLMGATAIVVFASLLAKWDVVRFIRYCGNNSIVLYISFTIPMAVTRTILLKTGLITDVGWASLMVWIVAALSPLILHLLVRNTPLRYLYLRPSWVAINYNQARGASQASQSAVNSLR